MTSPYTWGELVTALVSVKLKMVDKESNRTTRQMKEANWIRKTTTTVNRDEGNYELLHMYDDSICHYYLWSRCVLSNKTLYG